MMHGAFLPPSLVRGGRPDTYLQGTSRIAFLVARVSNPWPREIRDPRRLRLGKTHWPGRDKQVFFCGKAARADNGVCGPGGLVFPNPRGVAADLPRPRLRKPCHKGRGSQLASYL